MTILAGSRAEGSGHGARAVAVAEGSHLNPQPRCRDREHWELRKSLESQIRSPVTHLP